MDLLRNLTVYLGLIGGAAAVVGLILLIRLLGRGRTRADTEYAERLREEAEDP